MVSNNLQSSGEDEVDCAVEKNFDAAVFDVLKVLPEEFAVSHFLIVNGPFVLFVIQCLFMFLSCKNLKKRKKKKENCSYRSLTTYAVVHVYELDTACDAN